MQAVPLACSKPPKILPAGGTKACTKPNFKNNECKCIHEKSDSKECKTKLECRKVKCEANCSNNWAKLTKHASCTSSR